VRYAEKTSMPDHVRRFADNLIVDAWLSGLLKLDLTNLQTMD
jgi:hypothetical protein